MTMRIAIITAAVGIVLSPLGGVALAQGTTAPSAGAAAGAAASQGTVVPHVPHHKVTPSRYMQHPRPVPEPQTVDALNAMSLDAARRGVNFVPPPPGAEHQQAGGGMAKP